MCSSPEGWMPLKMRDMGASYLPREAVDSSLLRRSAPTLGIPHTTRSFLADHIRALLATCVAAAAKAGEFIRERSADRATIVVEEKSRADFVSDVDRGAEQLITALIRERHP